MLQIFRFEERAEAGAAGATVAAEAIARLVDRDGYAAVIFASAVSQDPFLAALRERDLDWPRVTAFHMDEYAGMSGSHPASFRRFLRERLFDHVPVKRFEELRGDATDLEAECARYAGFYGRPGRGC